MKLIQYWDSGTPPDDVADAVRTVRELNPEFRHRLFDRDSAAWFIGKNIGAREREAFRSLAVPAAQADYFRFCALSARGGLWVDADMRCVRPLRSLLAEAPEGYLSMLGNMLEMDVLYAPRAGNPLFRACMELVTERIERRMEGTTYDVTGPRALNLIWAAVDPLGAHEDPHLARHRELRSTADAEAVAARHPGAGQALARMVRRHNLWTDQWVKVLYAAYKSAPVDWRNWRGSLYRPAQPAGTI